MRFPWSGSPAIAVNHRFVVFLASAIAAVALLTQFGQGWRSAFAVDPPNITVNPISGPRDTQVTVSGSGFEVNTQVALSWDQPSTNLGTVIANSGGLGTFSFQFAVPVGSALGTHRVTARQTAFGGVGTGPGTVLTASATFTVTAGPPTKYVVSASTNSPAAGSDVTVSAQLADQDNFAVANSGITVNWSKTGTNTGALSRTASTTNPSGVATTILTTTTQAGVSTTVRATDTSARTGASGAIVTVAGSAATLATTSGNNQSGTVATALADPFVVIVTDTHGNPVSGFGVTFAFASVPAGATGQALSPTTVATGTNGQAFTTLTLGNRSGSYTVTATATGLAGSPQTFTGTAQAGAATKLAFLQQPSGGVADQAWSQQPSVEVQDQFGNQVMTATDTVTLTLNSPAGVTGATLTCAQGGNQVQAANGQAVFSACRVNAAGAGYTLTAAASGRTSAISRPFNITTGAPTTLALTSGNNQSARVRTALASPFVVTVTDNVVNPVSGFTVTWAIATVPTGASQQTLSALTTATNASGQASTVLTLGTRPGSYTVTATAAGLTPSSVTFTATATVGPPSKIGKPATGSGDGQQKQVSTALDNPFVVDVADEFDNPVSSVAVTWEVAAPGGATGQALSATSATNANGRASATLTLGNRVGTHSVTAAASDLTGSPVTFTATATPGPAARLAKVSGDGLDGEAGTALSQPFVVQVQDASGNTVSGVAVSFAVTQKPNAAATSGSLSPVSPQNSSSTGRVSTTYTLGNTAGTYQVTFTCASCGATAQTQTQVFTVTAVVVPDVLAKISGDAQSAPQNQVVTLPLTVEVTDTVVGALNDVAVTFSITAAPADATGQSLTGGGATGTTVTVTTSTIGNNTGRAQATLKLGSKLGQYTVTATCAACSTTKTVIFTANAVVGAPSKLVFVVQPGGGVAAPQTWTQQPTVQVQDSLGNRVTTATNAVTLTLNSPAGVTGAALTCTANPLAAAGGNAGFASCQVNTAASGYTLTAAASGLTSATSTAFNITTGAPTTLARTSGDNQSGVVATTLAVPFVVTVTDGINPVSGFTVTWAVTASPGGATGQDIDQVTTGAQTTLTTTTNASGQASTVLTLGTRPGTYTVTATATGLTPSSVPFTATAAVGAAAKITKTSGDGQQAQVGVGLGNPFVVTVTDAEDNPVSGVTVTWGVAIPSSATGQALSATTTTGTNGRASATLTLGNRVGTYTVTAASTGLTGSPVAFTATAKPGAAARLVKVSGDGLGGEAGAALFQPFVVQVQDASGNAVSGAAVSFAVTQKPAGATDGSFSPASPQNSNATGQVSTTYTLGNTDGTYQVTFTCAVGAGGCTTNQTVTFAATAVVVPDDLRKVSGDAPVQTAAQGQNILQPLVIDVNDDAAGLRDGVSVTFTITGTPAGATGQSLTAGNSTGESVTVPTSTVSGNVGRAQVNLKLGSRLGDYTVTAICVVCTRTKAVTFTATAVIGTPDRLVLISGNNQGAKVTDPLAAPFVAEVRDAKDNPINGVSVSLTVTQKPANATDGSFNPASPLVTGAGASGQVSTTYTTGNTAGQYQVTFTCNACATTKTVVFSATATASAPDKLLRLSGHDQPGTVGANLVAPLVVEVRDATNPGNLLAGVSVTFTITAAPGGATEQDIDNAAAGAQTTFTAATGTNGQVQAVLKLGTRPGAYTVTATCDACSTTKTVTFTSTATVGAAATLEPVAGRGQQAPVRSVLQPFVIEAQDAFGNPVPGVAVAFGPVNAPTGAAGQVLGATIPANGQTGLDGRISATLTLGNKTGSYFVPVASGGVSTSFNPVATAGTAASIVRVSGTSQTGAVGTVLKDPFMVRLLDADSNVVPGVDVTFTVVGPAGATGADINPAQAQAQDTVTVASDGLGLAQATLTLGSAPGTYTTTPRAGGLTGQAFASTGTAGVPTQVQKITGDNQTGVLLATLEPLVVRAADALNNPVANVQITFTVAAPADTFTNPDIDPATGGLNNTRTVTTNSLGLASTVVTLGDGVGAYTVTASSDLNGNGVTADTGESTTFTLAGVAPPPAIATEVTPQVTRVGASTSYRVRVSIQQTIPAGGALRLTFPDVSGLDFDLSNARIPVTQAAQLGLETTPAFDQGNRRARIGVSTVKSPGTILDFVLGDTGQLVTNTGDCNLVVADATCPRSGGYSVTVETSTSAGAFEANFRETSTSRPFFIEPPTSITVFGRVVGPDGTTGLNGVTVSLTGPRAGTLTATTQTIGGVAGSFQVNDVPQDNYGLTTTGAVAGGFNDITTPVNLTVLVPAPGNALGTLSNPIQLRLTALEHTVNGTVTGPAGVAVEVIASSSAGVVRVSSTLSGARGSGLTGASSYTLRLVSGDWNITVQPPAGVAVAEFVPAAPRPLRLEPPSRIVSNFDFTLDFANFTLSGRMVDRGACPVIPGGGADDRDTSSPNCAGVPGAQVVVSESGAGGARFNASTNTLGSFSVPVRTGGYVVSVSATGFSAIAGAPVTIGPTGAQSPAPLVISAAKPPVTISGRVLRGTTPISDAAISGVEVNTADGSAKAGAKRVTATTNAAGEYALSVSISPAPSRWSITATIFGVGTTSPILVPAAAGTVGTDVSGQNITLPAVAALNGTVEIDGVRVAGAAVTGDPTSTAFPGLASVNTDSEGNFTLLASVPPTGTFSWNIRVVVPDVGGLPTQQVTVNAQGAISGASLSFSFRSSTVTVTFSRPVQETFVRLTSTTATFASANSKGLRADSATIGSVALRVARPADGGSVTYGVSVSVTGFAFADLTLSAMSVAVPGDQTVTVTLPPTQFTVSGTVTDDATPPNPVGGAQIDLVQVVAAGATPFSGNTTTNSSGAYSITVPATATATDYVITAAKQPDFLPSTITKAVSANTTQDLTLTPVPPITIQGLVNGPPQDGSVEVTVTATKGTDTIIVKTNTQGPHCGASKVPTPVHYCMSVSAGNWTVTATADGFSPASKTVTAPATLPQTLITLQAVVSPPGSNQQGTPAGGVISKGQGGSIIIVTIPPGALGAGSEVVTLTIKPTTDAPSTATLTPRANVAIDLSVVDRVGRLVTRFNTPVTVRIEEETPGEFAGFAGVVGFFDPTAGNWRSIPTCTRDATGFTCLVDHFTKFSLLSAKVTTPPPPPPPPPPPAPVGPAGGGGGAPVIVPPGPPSATATFDSATGGSVSLEGISVNVPAGATATPTSLTVNIAAATVPAAVRPPEGFTTGGRVFTLTVSGDTGTVTEFAKGLQLTVPYTDADVRLAGGDPKQLKLFRYDEAAKTWQALETTVDTVAGTLKATTTKTSLFAILVDLPTPANLVGPRDGIVFGLGTDLAWTNPANTAQYQIQVVPVNNDGPAINLIIGAADLVALARYQVPPPVLGQGNYIMLPGMSYTWRVRTSPLTTALKETDSGWSKYVSGTFRTSSPTSVTIAPESIAAGGVVSSLTPTLQWRNANTNIFYYEVQLSTDPAFNDDPKTAMAAVYWNLVHGGVSTPANSWTVPSGFALEAGKLYSWRVRPRVQGDGIPVDWSDTWTFRTP